LRKQLLMSSILRDAKYVESRGRVFVDPFVPYVPSPYFKKVMENNSVTTLPLKPNYAEIAITNKCPCECFHCHVKNTDEPDLPRSTLLEAIDDIAEEDFPLVIFVGGEPMSRFDTLLQLVKRANEHMDARMFTSGVGASRARFEQLRAAGLSGVNVSLDHSTREKHNELRKHPQAFAHACSAVRSAREVGLYVSVVCCVTRESLASGDVFRVVDLAEQLGAHSIQLNEIRPAGRALDANDPSLFLTESDKEVLIDYYRRQNASARPIAIVLPWHNEAPHRFGCTATSGQKVYIDAKGNVTPCVLLKASIGNIAEKRFKAIWSAFLPHCSHPVRECIIEALNETLVESPTVPLPRAATLDYWSGVANTEPTDAFKRFNVTHRRDAHYSLAYLQGKYNLGLKETVDFEFKRDHWLPNLLGPPYIAFRKTLYGKKGHDEVPLHEYLHLAQFDKFGAPRVLLHYLGHIARAVSEGANFKDAFVGVPFEVEARAFEKYPVQLADSRSNVA